MGKQMFKWLFQTFLVFVILKIQLIWLIVLCSCWRDSLQLSSVIYYSIFQISWFRRSQDGRVVLISVGDDIYLQDKRYSIVRPVLSMVSFWEKSSTLCQELYFN